MLCEFRIAIGNLGIRGSAAIEPWHCPTTNSTRGHREKRREHPVAGDLREEVEHKRNQILKYNQRVPEKRNASRNAIHGDTLFGLVLPMD